MKFFAMAGVDSKDKVWILGQCLNHCTQKCVMGIYFTRGLCKKKKKKSYLNQSNSMKCTTIYKHTFFFFATE